MHRIADQRLTHLRKQYPVGSIVELVHMDDIQAPPAGMKGQVIQVDDIGTIHIKWKNGSTLGVVPGVDMIKKLT